MFELTCPLNLAEVHLQISPMNNITVISVAAISIAVVLVGVMLVLVLRMRNRPEAGFHIHHLHSIPPLSPNSGQTSPTNTVLEMLQKDLDDASASYSAGLLSKKDFDDRVAEVKKTLEDLRQLTEIAPKNKKCNGCGAEIETEAKFCDRCGAKQ